MKNGSRHLKFKKIKKGKINKYRFKSKLNFGFIGLKTLQSGILNTKQIESLKKTIKKITKNKLKFWFKTAILLPISSKSIGTRMGKGKGKISHFVTRIKAGTILIELSGSNKKLLIKSLLVCKLKLSVKTCICLK